MANMIQYAKEQVSRVIAQAYEKAAAAGALPGGVAVKGTVEIPKDPKNGDYAASFAMAGAKAMKMAPRAIAQALVDHMDLGDTPFASVEIAGPGFLNFRLGHRWYGQVLSAIESEGAPLRPEPGGAGEAGHGGVRLCQPHRPHAHGQRPGRRAGGHLGQRPAPGWV